MGSHVVNRDGSAFLRFHKGQRVRFSAEGLAEAKGQTHRLSAQTLGTVVGYNRMGDCVLVRWDHFKSSRLYHESFIDVA